MNRLNLKRRNKDKEPEPYLEEKEANQKEEKERRTAPIPEQGLYIKARPQTIDEVYGNNDVKNSIKRLVKSDTLPHCFLFTGESGTGKTTMARILARMLGCEDKYDIVELNASNSRGIDTSREISRKAFFRPLSGNNKCYIIDESHQMTKPAQEALLKILEDCPPYTFFIFCTTNPENILVTIKNRSSVYRMRALSVEEMDDLLKDVRERFKLKVSNEILNVINDASDGSSRSALVCLEQVNGLSEEEAEDIIFEKTGKNVEIFEVCKMMTKGAKTGALVVLDKMKLLKGTDPEANKRVMLKFFTSCLFNSRSMEEAEYYSDIIIKLENVNIFANGEASLVRAVFDICNYK